MTAKQTYKLSDSETGVVLSENISPSELGVLIETYTDIGYDVMVTETAAAGSVGAASIAVNMSGGTGKIVPLKTMQMFMNAFNSKVKNKFQPKPVNFTIKINEAFDIESVFSRLSSLEKAGQPKPSEGTTFGIEDDNGNLMKVTVRADQATDFEAEVATYLADIKANIAGMPAAKDSSDVSMAELLFKMKDKFDIIDVEFPTIPTDVIYNADKASYSAATPEVDMGDMGDMGDDGTEQQPADNPMDPLDLTDFEDTESQPEIGGAGIGDEELGDAESVEDFADETEGESSEGSILNKVIDMLKSQAEAETEKHRAEQEKARAEQARYTAQATQFAMKDEEEKLRYELEIEEEKRREKEARRMADMAKHRISKTLSATAGMSESEEGLTPAMVLKMKSQLSERFRILNTDSPEVKQYKAKMYAAGKRELDAKYQQAVIKQNFDAQQAREQKDKSKQQNPQQQQQQQQQGDNTGAPNNEV